MDTSETKTEEVRLDKYGRRGVISGYAILVFQIIVTFSVAGTLSWINAWLLFGSYAVFLTTFFLVIRKVNPALMNERGKGLKEGTKKFDKVVFAVWRVLLLAAIIIAPLDAVRFGWSSMPAGYSLAGFAVLLCGFIITIWAPVSNTHFEASVRIQHDRDHTVVKGGPYRYVRHPGYVGLILANLGSPFVLGSWWGLIPASLIVILVIVRTALEDRTLRRELPGYEEFTQETRYRLIPQVW